MKLLNLPPFKVGDRVQTVWGPRTYTVYEVRYAGGWQANIAGYWIACKALLRINENTTEESPSGATVEEVMRSGNQYPPTYVVETTPVSRQDTLYGRPIIWNGDPQSPSGVQSLDPHLTSGTFSYNMNGKMYTIQWGSTIVQR